MLHFFGSIFLTLIMGLFYAIPVVYVFAVVIFGALAYQLYIIVQTFRGKL